jgi:hypothetical protein
MLPSLSLSGWSARFWWDGAWLLIALAGLAASVSLTGRPGVTAPQATVPPTSGLSADLALYRDLVADVREGRDYYAAARLRIAAYGFPIDSPLNWRLPTTAWLLAALPSLAWGQALLATLSLAVLALGLSGQFESGGMVGGWLLVTLWAGVLRWAMDGYAFLAQEPWAAALIAGSLAASSLGERHARWQWLSAALGTAALLVRELALPFCVVMAAQQWVGRRWTVALGWIGGMALFMVYYLWHLERIHAQWALAEVSGGAGVWQWLRLGGLAFVLRTLRMNGWLFSAPTWLLWLYLVLAGYGLGRARNRTTSAAGWSCVLYLLAFAVVGRPENLYWGLVPAPLLALGAVEGVQRLLQRARDLDDPDEAASASGPFCALARRASPASGRG